MRGSMFSTAQHAAGNLFHKIEEPRVIRVFHFCIYIVLGVMGVLVIGSPPPALADVLGDELATSMGASLFVGGAIGAVAVLPGIWWAERLAIISLASGLMVYLAAAFALDTSVVRVGITLSMILSLALRWIEVRKYQVAPGK